MGKVPASDLDSIRLHPLQPPLYGTTTHFTLSRQRHAKPEVGDVGQLCNGHDDRGLLRRSASVSVAIEEACLRRRACGGFIAH